MIKILKKIPLIFWAILLSAVSYKISHLDFFSTNDPIKLWASFLTFIGLIFVAINLQKQWKNERIKTEYLNQPEFEIKGFTCEFDGCAPKKCGNYPECDLDHWFDIKQTGNLPALNLKVTLINEKENSNINSIDKERWISEIKMSKNQVFQYKIKDKSIPIHLYNHENINGFYLLMSYTSEYSGIKYKRIYQLCATPLLKDNFRMPKSWRNVISFYDCTLYFATDSETISTYRIIKNNIRYLLSRINSLKKYSHVDWVYDF